MFFQDLLARDENDYYKERLDDARWAYWTHSPEKAWQLLTELAAEVPESTDFEEQDYYGEENESTTFDGYRTGRAPSEHLSGHSDTVPGALDGGVD